MELHTVFAFFRNWLILLSIRFSRFIHVVASVGISFLLKAPLCFIIPTHTLFLHLSTDGHLGCFYLSAIGNNAAMVYKHVFETMLSITWGIYQAVELLDHMIALFLFLFWGPAILVSIWTILQSTEHCTRVSISPHSHQPSLLLYIWYIIYIILYIYDI